jgi:hypothetical protein
LLLLYEAGSSDSQVEPLIDRHDGFGSFLTRSDEARTFRSTPDSYRRAARALTRGMHKISIELGVATRTVQRVKAEMTA